MAQGTSRFSANTVVSPGDAVWGAGWINRYVNPAIMRIVTITTIKMFRFFMLPRYYFVVHATYFFQLKTPDYAKNKFTVKTNR